MASSSLKRVVAFCWGVLLGQSVDNLGESKRGVPTGDITLPNTLFIHTLFHSLRFFNVCRFEAVQCPSDDLLNLTHRGFPHFTAHITVSLIS